MLERIVVPVESSTRLGGGDDEPEQHRAEQRVVLGRVRAGMGACEDRRSGLAGELVESEASIFARTQDRMNARTRGRSS